MDKGAGGAQEERGVKYITLVYHGLVLTYIEITAIKILLEGNCRSFVEFRQARPYKAL